MKTVARLLIPAAVLLLGNFQQHAIAAPPTAITIPAAVVSDEQEGMTATAPGFNLVLDYYPPTAPFAPNVTLAIGDMRVKWCAAYTGLSFPGLSNGMGWPGRWFPVGPVLAGHAETGRTVWMRMRLGSFLGVGEWVAAFDFEVRDTPFDGLDQSGNGAISTLDDLLAFVDKYLIGRWDADFNLDGSVTVQDLFDCMDALMAH